VSDHINDAGSIFGFSASSFDATLLNLLRSILNLMKNVPDGGYPSIFKLKRC